MPRLISGLDDDFVAAVGFFHSHIDAMIGWYVFDLEANVVGSNRDIAPAAIGEGREAIDDSLDVGFVVLRPHCGEKVRERGGECKNAFGYRVPGFGFRNSMED